MEGDIEGELLNKLDIPFYYNNLDYITLWRNYYELKKDVKILFLMKLKKISLDYYWLHVELANFFKRKKKPEVSVYILRKALGSKVYPTNEIERALKEYEGVEAMSENKVREYLYPKEFKALGRVWNSFIWCNYYNESLFKTNTGYLSLEEFRYNTLLRDDKIMLEWNLKKEERRKRFKLDSIQDLEIKGDEIIVGSIDCSSKIYKQHDFRVIQYDYHEYLVSQASEWLDLHLKRKDLRQSHPPNRDCNSFYIKDILENLFNTTEKSINLKEPHVILEFYLLETLKFVSENKDNAKMLMQLECSNLKIDAFFKLFLSTNSSSSHSTNLDLFRAISTFFNGLTKSKLFKSIVITSFIDLENEINRINRMLKVKENRHFVNKHKIAIIERICKSFG